MTLAESTVSVLGPVGGVVEVTVESGGSPVEHESGGRNEREVAALAVALAVVGVAGVSWHRYRRRAS